MTSTELHKIAITMHDLGFRGICIEWQEHESSVVLGIHVGGHFFPASELDDAENLAFLMNGMFALILARRSEPMRRPTDSVNR